MAITRSAKTSSVGQTSGTSSTSSFAVLPTTGHGVVVYVFAISGSSAFTGSSHATASDNQGVSNSYTLLKDDFTSGLYCGILACPSVGATSGTFTVTGTIAGATFTCVSAVDMSQLVGPVDASGIGGAHSTSPSATTTGATTQADSASFTVFTSDSASGASTVTDPASYSDDGKVTDGNLSQVGGGADRVLIATASQTATWTSTLANWICVIATLKGAGAGPTFIAPPPFVVNRAVMRAALY